MIWERDHEILRSFLDRESRMYRWIPDEGAETRRKAFVDKCFDRILNFWDGKLPLEKFNYIHVQSLTNMGCLDSELVLTAKDWDTKQSLYLFPPPSPLGGIGFQIKEGK